jgi:hypothetical protein
MLEGWLSSTSIVAVDLTHPCRECRRARRAPVGCRASRAQAGLPEPLGNFILDAPDHPRLEVDFYFPTHNLVVEADGRETHRTKAAVQSDRREDAALTSTVGG